jgi:hypothetical protein
MKKGTKINGVNCIIVNTNIKEIYKYNNDQLDPMFEINIPTKEMLTLLDFTYRGWQIEKREVKHKSYGIERNEKSVIVESDCVTYVAVNPSNR